MLSMHFQVRVPKYILKIIFAVIQTQTIRTAKKCFGFLRYFRFECQKIATTILSPILLNIGMFLLITQHCLCIELIMIHEHTFTDFIIFCLSFLFFSLSDRTICTWIATKNFRLFDFNVERYL